ncbi:MAG: metal ABC transporter ATP-binding protein [Chloroflexota bacterium]
MTGAEPAIAAAALAIGYPAETVVSGIGLRVAAGGSLALVGTNGSGKSTLLRTLAGLLPPRAGTLSVLGRPPGRAAGRVAYLAQAHQADFLLPIRSIDVVRMGRYARHGLLGRMGADDEAIVRDALATMGATHLADAPLGSLSGGQRRRVHLAQILAHRADLILLDEPTAGLDAGGHERYLDAFAAELHRGAALVTATHDIAEAIEYDEVLLLARRVVAQGPGAEILTPDRLMETFGIVIRDRHAEHAGRFAVAERGHGAPQVVELGGEPPAG